MTVVRLFLTALLAGLLLLAGPAAAQAPTEPAAGQSAAQAPIDYDLWESVASRAETTIDEGVDSNQVLETLRQRLVEFRTTFDTARKANAERIATLRSQIEALGPAPAEGESESAEIAQRRAQLNQQLTELLAPVQAADEAYTRADGLIRQIDSIIRERQTERLLSLGPSPLNPVLWPAAVEDSARALSNIWAEIRMLADPDHLGKAQQNLPLVLVLLVMAMMLLIRGRVWAMALGERLRRIGGRGSGVWSFVVSLLRVGLPLAGLYALTEALYATGVVGTRSSAILDALPIWGVFLLGFRWLSERLFSRNEDDAIIPMSPARRSWARFYVTIMALLMVAQGAIDLSFRLSDVPRASQSVVAFPLVVLLGFVLYRFGGLLRTFVPREASETEEISTVGQGVARLLRWVGLLAQVVSVAAPIMAAVGYSAFSEAILYPMILSMALLGFVMTLQHFASDVYGWLSGQGKAARDSLIAVLFALVLVVLSMPLLALIWGARVADLTELWTAFMTGFRVGEATISPTDFIALAVVFAIGFILTRLLQTALRTSILPKTRIDIGGQNAIVSGLGYVGIFLAAIIAIGAAGLDLSSLAIVAGALSVGIGFGLQNIVSNFVAGIILLIERPISEGDWIEVGGQHGYVRDISVRSTRIETFDRSDLIVPNSDLVSNTVTNYTRGNTVGRVIVPVHVARGSDTRRVEEILLDIAKSHPLVLLNPEPFALFRRIAPDALEFEIRAILRDVNWVLNVQSEMNHQIEERFAAEGIVIPFPQQDIWFRNPEAVRPDARAEAETGRETPGRTRE